MQYQDMILEASDAAVVKNPDKSRTGKFKVRVLQSPAGEMKPEEAIAVEYDDKKLQESLGELEKRLLDREGLIALGRTLALLLLPPQQEGKPTGVRELLHASLSKAGVDGGIRMRLRLPPLLGVIPWEYMYVERVGGGNAMDGFLALDPRAAIIRHEVLPSPSPLPTLSGDIKMVAVLASGEGLPLLDLSKEKSDLEKVFKDQAGVQVQFIEEATLDEVQAAVPGAGIFYFAGHGVFTRQMGDIPGTYSGIGSLALEGETVAADQLGINLRGNGIRLAVLGGCETGRRDAVSVWSGIAPALVKAEIPAVVANQYSIRDICAIAFSRQFYRSLVGGMDIERAVSAGRIAAYNADLSGRDWGVPVLYLRATDGRLFEGAADGEVRQTARSAAEVDVDVRVKNVAEGGLVCGADVKQMLSGKLKVRVTVSDTVYDEVVGVRINTLRNGHVSANVEAQTVGKDGRLTGVKIDNL